MSIQIYYEHGMSVLLTSEIKTGFWKTGKLGSKALKRHSWHSGVYIGTVLLKCRAMPQKIYEAHSADKLVDPKMIAT